MGWKDQFQWRKLKFSYEHPEQMVLCQWQTDVSTPTCYLLFRMVFLTFYLGIWYAGVRMVNISISCNCLPSINKGSIFLYYTTWSELFCCVASASSLLITVTQYVMEDEEEVKKSVFECRTWFKIHLVFYTLALDSSVALAFGYFGYVYYNERRYYRGISYVLHLWTGVLMLLDFMLSSLPTNLLHFYLTLSISLLYGLFSWVYYIVGGKDYLGEKYLYEILNWEDTPWTAIFAILGTFLFFVAVRVIVFAMSRLRDVVYHKYYYSVTEESVNPRNFVVVS
ncbi:protein rolling stone-like [Coccinella septempunctata]|uniref:protein rolling stone-like n=1 Tax=Coccinella septempunctata TaxID=41139 RepID=UPI001D083821|nr:protein rolling stone-like [Coccinella septempunctata]